MKKKEKSRFALFIVLRFENFSDCLIFVCNAVYYPADIQ
jgi:hypothetical protein